MKNKIIISSVLIGLIVITACLKSVWTGFLYFAVAFLAMLCLYWCGIFIYQYIDNYKWHFEEDFAFYRAEVINSGGISEADFEAGKNVYVKKFKRTQTREKMIDIFKILIAFSLAISCIVVMTTGAIR